MPSGRLDLPPFAVLGHRGLRDGATENTLAAIAAALSEGAHGVELDLRRAGDGEIVVFHDEDTRRLAGRDLLVATASVTELKDLQLAGGGRIATLDEVLRVLSARRAWADLELKEPELAGEAAEAASRHGLGPRTLFTSFEAEWLAGAAELGFPVGHITDDRGGDPLAEALAREMDACCPHEELVSREVVERAQEAGIALLPWTVNEPREALRLRTLGVAGVITDRPGAIVAALQPTRGAEGRNPRGAGGNR